MGTVVFEDDVTLQFQIDGNDPFTMRTYTLMDAQGEDGLIGTFTEATGLGAYMENVFKEGTELKVSILHDLHPGDANLDTKTNVQDFNEWNANKFTDGTEWISGDFNGDGKTNVLDFNVWNENKFTSVADPAPMSEGQVPEPGALILLACCGLTWLALRRRRKLG
jgi:hypothetical protein